MLDERPFLFDKFSQEQSRGPDAAEAEPGLLTLVQIVEDLKNSIPNI
jgi:hypothetical protein